MSEKQAFRATAIENPSTREQPRFCVPQAWAGVMGFTADGLPLIGRYAPLPGLTVAAGFNGGGFSWGAIVGRVVAALLAGRESGFDLAPFRPERFHAGGTAWRNPYTAGESGQAAREAAAPL